MPDVTRYKWFKYDGKEVTFNQDRHNEDFELELHPGNIFGVQKIGKGYLVLHKHSPDIEFSLYPAEINRIVAKSNGWSGKVNKITVKAGEGGLEKEPEGLPKGWREIALDSSNLRTAIYNPKEKTLYITFHNGASWAYENVTKREFDEMEAAESRGRYFIYRIKYVKYQYKLGDNFDRPPYDTKRLSESKMVPDPTKVKAVQMPQTVGHGEGKQSVKLKISKQALSNWAASERSDFENMHAAMQGSDIPVYTVIRQGYVEQERDILRLIDSLRSGKLSKMNKSSFKAAVKALTELGDAYPFTAKTAVAYKRQRDALMSLTKD